jgi:hypothetical protein
MTIAEFALTFAGGILVGATALLAVLAKWGKRIGIWALTRQLRKVAKPAVVASGAANTYPPPDTLEP